MFREGDAAELSCPESDFSVSRLLACQGYTADSYQKDQEGTWLWWLNVLLGQKYPRGCACGEKGQNKQGLEVKTSETEMKNSTHIQIECGWLLGRYAFAKVKLLHSEWV